MSTQGRKAPNARLVYVHVLFSCLYFFLNFIYVYTKRNVYLLNLRLKISFNNHIEYINVCILVYVWLWNLI